MKKIIEMIKKIIIGILGIAFFTFAIIMTVLLLSRNEYGVTQFDNTSLLLIQQEISSDKYKKGDLVIIEGKQIDKLKMGDEIFVYQVHDKGPVTIDLGIVGEINLEQREVSFENGATYKMDFVAGQATKVYNKIGMYLSIILSRWGFLFMILVPCLLIFIYEFYALIVEIKYGKDEEVAAPAQPNQV